MVYLLHLDTPFHHVRHYIGFVQDGLLERRLNYHRSGKGAKLMAAVSRAGIPFHVSRTWQGADRTFERKLKNRKKAADLCPVCKSKKHRHDPNQIDLPFYNDHLPF